VTIVSGTPVVYQDGRYVVAGSVPPATATVTTPGTVVAAPPAVVTPPPAPVVAAPPVVMTTPPAAVVTAPPAAVVTAPPATVVTAPPAAGMIRMYGRVTDIERNGNVKVRLADGNAFEFRPPAGTVVRKGDTVAIDMAFGGVAPSALPR
jgi:hypothetical protein